MAVKHINAKVWSILPSSDGKRWSAWPAGDKPSGSTITQAGVAVGIGAAAGAVSGGVAPSWAAPAVQPGWVYQSSYAVGVTMTADFGAALNSPDPSGYSYQLLRDGDPTGMPSGTNVSGFTYTPVSGDQFKQLSFTLTASNSGGSATTTAASVTIS
jgi:hypothetical protein